MWIESHQSLRNHPKVKKAARLAGINEYEMIGRLHCLWWWAIDYAPDGDVTRYSDDDIEDAVGWTGKRGAFVKALTECGFNEHCGFIETAGEERYIHDWHAYGGKLLERRETDAERKRAVRRTSTGHLQDGEQTAHVDKITNNTEQTIHTLGAKTPCPAEWMDRLYDITRIDKATATVQARSNISACGKALIAGHATIEMLDIFERNWYALDWRGKQSQAPTIKQIRDEWGKYSQDGNRTNAVNQGHSNQPQYTPEQLASAERINARRAALKAEGKNLV